MDKYTRVKTSSIDAHKFVQSQTVSVRNDLRMIRHALVQEFPPSVDETASAVAALEVGHSCQEHPWKHYNCLK